MDDIRRSGSRQYRGFGTQWAEYPDSARVDVAAVARVRPNRMMRGRPGARTVAPSARRAHALVRPGAVCASWRGTTGEEVAMSEAATAEHGLIGAVQTAPMTGRTASSLVLPPSLRLPNVAAASALLGPHIGLHASPTPMA